MPDPKTPEPDPPPDLSPDTSTFVRPLWAPIRAPEQRDSTPRISTAELLRPKPDKLGTLGRYLAVGAVALR